MNVDQTSVPTTGRRRDEPTRAGGRGLRALALAGAVMASLVLSPVAADASTGKPASTGNGIRTELRAAVDDVVATGVPGVIVHVQDPRRADRRFAAGVRDLETAAALRPAAQFRIGSITKTFVSTVVLQLVGEGRLRLDEPVAGRLPGLLVNGEHITMRQLLNHTSGLPDYGNDPELLVGIGEDRVWKPRELVALSERHPQLFEPGTAWSYSNTNYVVAGMLVEAVSGLPLAHELDRRIFSPLRLRHTSLPAATASMPGYHAHGYTSTEFIPTPDGRPLDVTGYNASHAWAAGAIVSNAADLTTFYRSLLEGRLLSRPLLREMQTTVAVDPTDPARTFSYGLGLWRVADACGANWGHFGTLFGYQSQSFWNERTRRTVVIASNMWPAPAAAEGPLAAAADLALCQ